MDDASEIALAILQDAFLQKATDIHFHPHKDNIIIYFRIIGERQLHQTISKSSYQQLLLYFKFSSGMDIGEQNLPQNGAMTIPYEKSKYYFLRLSTLPSYRNESLAIRLLPQYDELSLHNLFLFHKQFKTMLSWFSYKSGLILFSGKTGSGKTTTMYSLLQKLVKEQSFHTITLEDPIEKNIPNLLQVEINESAGFSYSAGLRAVLRHDPDIILIGEILDQKTAKFALHAALTGHLVLSTLHANSATGTIDRLLSMDIKPTDLSQSLIAVAALELIPIQIGGDFRRRVAIAELLTDKQLQNSINNHKANSKPVPTFQQLKRKAYAYGFLSKVDFF